MIKFKVDMKPLQKQLNGKTLKASQTVTGIIGSDMKKEVEMRFRTERGTDGSPWQPLKYRSLIAKYNRGLRKSQGKKAVRGRSKILQDTGTLKRSITMRHDNREAAVGTNIKYAKVHNFGFGKKNIPARPYMGLSRRQKEKYREIIRKWKNREL